MSRSVREMPHPEVSKNIGRQRVSASSRNDVELMPSIADSVLAPIFSVGIDFIAFAHAEKPTRRPLLHSLPSRPAHGLVSPG